MQEKIEKSYRSKRKYKRQLPSIAGLREEKADPSLRSG
jgi:hypothetical protein